MTIASMPFGGLTTTGATGRAGTPGDTTDHSDGEGTTTDSFAALVAAVLAAGAPAAEPATVSATPTADPLVGPSPAPALAGTAVDATADTTGSVVVEPAHPSAPATATRPDEPAE
ncbi:MAG: hypothetical protein VX747_08210, partial [Actinomycetota bacterium]|nr:hypothetical protein [Actinomycetota bacterium]